MDKMKTRTDEVTTLQQELESLESTARVAGQKLRDSRLIF